MTRKIKRLLRLPLAKLINCWYHEKSCNYGLFINLFDSQFSLKASDHWNFCTVMIMKLRNVWHSFLPYGILLNCAIHQSDTKTILMKSAITITIELLLCIAFPNFQKLLLGLSRIQYLFIFCHFAYIWKIYSLVITRSKKSLQFFKPIFPVILPICNFTNF